jgi:hypothetical protein
VRLLHIRVYVFLNCRTLTPWSSVVSAVHMLAALILGTKWWVISFTLLPLYPGKRCPSTHSIGGCVGPSAGLESVERRQISCPFLGIEPQFHGCQPLGPSLYRLSYPGSQIKVPYYVVFSILPLLPPLWGPNILLSNLFSNSRNIDYSLGAKDHVTNPYKTRGNIIVCFYSQWY